MIAWINGLSSLDGERDLALGISTQRSTAPGDLSGTTWPLVAVGPVARSAFLGTHRSDHPSLAASPVPPTLHAKPGNHRVDP
ncbi:hypothetical protein FM106_09135 [Brachybacterium faecium]|nr:hypothetical protein FM106_09135 [Brachybacterium faecium]